MHKMIPTLKLIRLPNLVIIALTLYAFRYMVLQPYYGMSGTDLQLDSFSFGVMVAVTMLIAVTGYLINDYFDTGIDLINRPDRPSVNGSITPGSLRTLAIAFSLMSIAGMILLVIRIHLLTPLFIFMLSLFTVWWYARRLKKSLAWGNLAVSFMSSLTIGMAWFYEWLLLQNAGLDLYEIKPITEITIGIIVFAFFLTFIREVIKDMEDMEGDRRFGSRSIPISLGIPATRKIILIATILLILLLLTAQYFLTGMNFPLVVFWLVPSVELPLLLFIYRLYRASSPVDYHRLSTLLKWIMVGGIFSMLVIWINFKF